MALGCRKNAGGIVATPNVTENDLGKTPSAERPRRPPAAWRILKGGWRIGRCWVRYLASGAQSGVPSLVDFVSGNYLFRAVQQKDELRSLGEILARRSPDRALEIGTFLGGTLFFLTRLASPRATIISIDLPGGEFGGGYSARRAMVYRRFARAHQRLHLLRGNSHSEETLARVKATLEGQPLDYLYIDGDHTYAGAKRDFELYSPLVRKGGIIAMHDIAEHAPVPGGNPSRFCDVSRFWNEIKSHYRHTEFVKDPKQGWAGIGLLYVD